jgi:hypothetical protein
MRYLEFQFRTLFMPVGRDCLLTAATNGTTVHPPGGIRLWTANVELYRQGKPRNSEGNLSQCHYVHCKSHMD